MKTEAKHTPGSIPNLYDQITKLRSDKAELLEALQQAANAHGFDGAWKPKARALITKHTT